MKKILFLALLLTGIISNAQVRNYKGNKSGTTKTTKKVAKKDTYSDSESKFGILAGVLISNETGDDIESTAPRTGFYAGLSYKTNFSDALGLELDLVYATMGAEFQDQYSDELNYLQLPATLNIKLGNVLSAQFGPQIGYLLSAKFDGSDYIETLNKIDYGIVAGLGVEFPNTNFGLNGRYYYGLGNINNDTSIGAINNSSYSIGAFYNF